MQASVGKSSGGGNGRNGGTGANKRAGGSNGNGGNGNGNGRKKRKRPPSTGKLILINILKALFVVACLAVVAGSIFAVSLVRYAVESTEDDDLDLSTFVRSSTGYIMAYNPSNANAEEEDDASIYHTLVGESNSIWVELKDIPQYMQDAVISTEDRDFWDHNGFSVTRTAFAFVNEIFHFRTQFGGSTLDQQLVKNITGEKEVTGADGETTAGYQRKIREIYRAWVLNKNFSKQMILEAYLNTMPLTGTIVGVQAAAYEYFYVEDLNQLSVAQCAMIIGITNAPGRYNPYVNPEQCKIRRDYVLSTMKTTGTLSEEDYQKAIAEDLNLYTGQRERATNEVNSYFTDALFEEVIKDLQDKFDISRTEAVRRYYNYGWRIYATVNTDVQTEMERVYSMGQGDQAEGYIFPDISAEIEKTDDNGNKYTETVTPQSAMVTIDYSGNLVGVVGGLGPKTESLSLNRATQSVRQVGSTMKAIGAYVLGIENGAIDYSSMIEDSGIKPNPSKPVRDPETGELINNWPQNVFNTGGKGDPTLVVDALTVSLNTVAVKVGVRVGVQEMFDFMTGTLNITSLVSEGAYTDLDLAPLVLGSMTHGISPIELAAAYQILGNDGSYNSVHTYSKIIDSNGNIVMEPKRTQVQAVSPETAYIMNRMLRNVFGTSTGSAGGGVNGTAKGMGLSMMESAAKTGTTTDDRDRWIVGLTPYYVSTVWWGYDEIAELDWTTSPTKNATILCWNTVNETIHQNLAPKPFYESMPGGVVEHQFCRDTGELATANCTNVQTGYYNVGLRVPDECYIHSHGIGTEGE